MIPYQVTVRYGGERVRYHTADISAGDIREALSAAAGEIPDEVAESADLVELRVSIDPDDRSYVGA